MQYKSQLMWQKGYAIKAKNGVGLVVNMYSGPCIFETVYLYVHLFRRTTKLYVVTWGMGVYLGVSHASHPKRGEFSALLNCGGSPVFMPTPFNAERPNSAL